MSHFDSIKGHIVRLVLDAFPSPHGELLLGMVFGMDLYRDITTFNDVLIKTGMIHVAVVSGYNINLIVRFIVNIFGGIYTTKKLFIVFLTITAYVVFVGFEPPVMRAWIMSTIVMLAKFYGRKINPLIILTFSASFMIFYVKDLSFQLSALSTLGLILFADKFQYYICKILKMNNKLLEDLSTSLAAQVLIIPLISYKFGRISLIAPIVGMLLLWTVPPITILGAFYVILSTINVNVGKLLYLPNIAFIDIFVRGVEFFSYFPYSSLNVSILKR